MKITICLMGIVVVLIRSLNGIVNVQEEVLMQVLTSVMRYVGLAMT